MQQDSNAINDFDGASTSIALRVPHAVNWASTLLPIASWLKSQPIENRNVAALQTLILLPFAQLLSVARECWPSALAIAGLPVGTLCPRIETTQSWMASLPPVRPEATDYTGQVAQDWLKAHSIAHKPEHVPGLLCAASELLPLAQSHRPEQRAAWAAECRARLPIPGAEFSEALREESLISQLALAWLGQSRLGSDGLWSAISDPDRAPARIFSLPGWADSPFERALRGAVGQRWTHLSWQAAAPIVSIPSVHRCSDVQAEAQEAAALLLRLLGGSDRAHVALVAEDRLLVRRTLALLEATPGATNYRLRDETGWRLSTTRAAAQLMAWLRAAELDPGTDVVLEALKGMGLCLNAIEPRLRRLKLHRWRQARARVVSFLERPEHAGSLPSAQLLTAVMALDELAVALKHRSPLADALRALRQSLRTLPAWRPTDDVAQRHCEQALSVQDPSRWAGFECSRQDFLAWVQAVMESENFQPHWPESPGTASTLTIVPMAQCMARSFTALVFPGAGEDSLAPPSPAVGWWTATQRDALGLPDRAANWAQSQSAFAHVWGQPGLHILWRERDERGETRLPSLLLQSAMLDAPFALGQSAMVQQKLVPFEFPMPRPLGIDLPQPVLSASSYRDWRTCPYRFWAQHLLNLRDLDELDDALDARDWGNWLHRMLELLHEDGDAALRTMSIDEALDACAERARQDQGIEVAAFVPFAAAWASIREHYRAWLLTESSSKTIATEQEKSKAIVLNDVKESDGARISIRLKGTVDRLVSCAGGIRLLDYKADSAKTAKRFKANPQEDVQLAFYALLQERALAEAGYLSFTEGREANVGFAPHPSLRDGAARLQEAIKKDVMLLQQGGALTATAEGEPCRRCSSRGLCRKDHWPSFDVDAAENGVLVDDGESD